MRFSFNPIFITALFIGVVVTLCVMQYTGYAPWQIYGHYR